MTDLGRPDCPDCVTLKQLLLECSTTNAEMVETMSGLHIQLRRAGRAEVALRNELAKVREDDPDSKDVRGVCDYWKRALGHEKARVPLTGARAKAVRLRLRERFTVADLKKAVDGCAKMPYVGAGGRKATGAPGQLYDDLTLICRDEETVERFIRYADEPVVVANGWTGPTGVPVVLERLEAVRETRPGQWEARCPAHEDRHASLSVAQGEKGAVLHCHAGCTAEQISHALSLDVAALFDREDRPVVKATRQPDPVPSAETVAAWRDLLAQRQPLLGRLRELRGWTAGTLFDLGVGWDGERLTLPVYGPDGAVVNLLRYLPRRTNGQRKLLALGGRSRDLFPRLDHAEGEVWLVEGEPDAISGRELGLTAYAVPGSNGWRKEWAARLTGCRVVICFDCDEPGRKAAAKIYEDLSAVTDVVVLDLEPERTDGYDLSDALMDGLDGQFLRVMADAIVAVRA